MPLSWGGLEGGHGSGHGADTDGQNIHEADVVLVALQPPPLVPARHKGPGHPGWTGSPAPAPGSVSQGPSQWSSDGFLPSASLSSLTPRGCGLSLRFVSVTRGSFAVESFHPETPTARVDPNTSPVEHTSFVCDTRRPRKPPDPSGGLTRCAGLQTQPIAPTLSHGRGHLRGALAGYSNGAGVALVNVCHLLLKKELGFLSLSSEPVAHALRPAVEESRSPSLC